MKCLRCRVVRICLRCSSCKLLSPCILILLRAYALRAFTLYVEGLCLVSFCSLWWGLMPCECIYALMLGAHAPDGTTCMVKKLKLHNQVELSSCWVVKMLRCFLYMSCDELFMNALLLNMMNLMMFMLLTVIDELYA